MSGLLDNLTGATAARQQRDADLARQQQSVATARQISQSAEQSALTSHSRQPARGRKLLSDAKTSDLPATVS